MLKGYYKSVLVKLKSLFAHEGVVGPHTGKEVWDEQFSSEQWAYLGDVSQREHYDLIIKLYKEYCKGGSILDIGCGVGILYRYLVDTRAMKHDDFLGVDISDVAVTEAAQQFGKKYFEVADYNTAVLPGRYDVIIFNETLYYFNHAGKTLQKCIDENLNPGGQIIISMCDHARHDLIWDYIDKFYHVVDAKKCADGAGNSWTIKIITAE